MIDESSLETVLESLIEIDTSNPPGRNYGKIIKLIERQLSSTRCKVELVETPKKRVKELVSEARGISG